MSPSKLFLLFLTFVASVGALSTPHARGLHHRALAGRITVPEVIDVPSVPVRKRQNSKRCKPRPSSVTLAVSAKETTSTKEAVPTKEPATTKEAPTTKETQAPTTHKDPPPPPPTHKDPPPPPPTHKDPPPTTHQASPTPKPAPPPTKEAPPPPATTKKPAPPPASDLPSYLTGTNTGDATFYATGLGACGITSKDTDFIAAASMLLFDGFLGYEGPDPNGNPICGRKVAATYQGKSVLATIVDRCVGCSKFSLDFSPAAFNQLGTPSEGRLHGMQWHFI